MTKSTYRAAYPDPWREFRVMPDEAGHYRSDLQVGETVRVGGTSGMIARIVAWDHTWSHIRGGRIAHLEVVAYDYGRPRDQAGAWESDLTRVSPASAAAGW
jgi:hypothetical protein